MTDCNLRNFDEFSVGDVAFFKRSFYRSSFEGFEELSGDSNPLHWDRSYAETVRRQTIWDQSVRFLRDTFLPVIPTV